MSLGYTKGTDMLDSEQCPDCKRINEVLSRVGDRWSVLVVISLSRYGTLRFNELKRHLGISQRMLSLTLRELERDGLVNRTYHPTIPPKVEYSLTPMGESFREPVRALGHWALENQAIIDAARETYDAAAEGQNAGKPAVPSI
ncbi:winged helix-turn-helix transcriptional regulator [Thalassovita taeanensis]|uniref:Transcriptional regulator, HxlR family n=1 Tax=Thalassovita taeanensis TaxID=657014 RepID=A0A1H8Z2Y1_9RHOB|nr:helix-turn-helix domain-containing protein [Thalassovita taeanensis]SEP58701.1 transcriptional regulator, HxlR family [Thalassovita taeanensis]